MGSKLWKHLRSNVVGYVALFIALTTGTAYAANTVFSADIVDGEVRTADLAGLSVTTAKLATGAAGTAQLKDAAVTTPKLAANSVNSAKIVNDSIKAEDLAGGGTPAAGARAWGLFRAADGTLPRQKNITGVRVSDEFGYYCIDPGPGIDPATAVMVVGEDAGVNNTDSDGDDMTHSEWDSLPPAGACNASEMAVVNYTALGSEPSFGSTDSGGFDLQEEVEGGFTFVIP